MTHSRRPSDQAQPRRRPAAFSELTRALYALLVLAPLMMGARDCERVVVGHECDGGTCDGCTYAGAHHDVGDSFASEDGCNTCSCEQDGTVSCTERACADLCGGLQGLPCAAGEYCHFAIDAQCGAADQTGTCAPIPQACTLQYDPVCGCDGITYGNACEAAGSGVSVAHAGECGGGSSCGGLLGQGCPSGEYCNFSEDALCGAADGTGTCTAIPQVCTDIYMPVCGCDDVTYGNACEAAASGISVARTGACEGGGGDTCGGLLGADCPSGEYCNFPEDALCGAADGTGTCATIPQICPAIYMPVCGCDDMTYGNACEAAASGVSVLHQGECEGGGGSGASCGVRGAPECPDGEFCNFTREAQCAAADQPGSCTTLPQACTREYVPVCGCDGATYGNECTANMAGVAVAHDGACSGAGSGDTCGGFAGLPCAAEEFCNYPIDAQCGAADQTGSCELPPTVCTADYTPVCGCDGMTYGNSCSAHAAGVSVAATGECP